MTARIKRTSNRNGIGIARNYNGSWNTEKNYYLCEKYVNRMMNEIQYLRYGNWMKNRGMKNYFC